MVDKESKINKDQKIENSKNLNDSNSSDYYESPESSQEDNPPSNQKDTKDIKVGNNQAKTDNNKVNNQLNDSNDSYGTPDSSQDNIQVKEEIVQDKVKNDTQKDIVKDKDKLNKSESDYGSPESSFEEKKSQKKSDDSFQSADEEENNNGKNEIDYDMMQSVAVEIEEDNEKFDVKGKEQNIKQKENLKNETTNSKSKEILNNKKEDTKFKSLNPGSKQEVKNNADNQNDDDFNYDLLQSVAVEVEDSDKEENEVKEQNQFSEVKQVGNLQSSKIDTHKNKEPKGENKNLTNEQNDDDFNPDLLQSVAVEVDDSDSDKEVKERNQQKNNNMKMVQKGNIKDETPPNKHIQEINTSKPTNKEDDDFNYDLLQSVAVEVEDSDKEESKNIRKEVDKNIPINTDNKENKEVSNRESKHGDSIEVKKPDQGVKENTISAPTEAKEVNNTNKQINSNDEVEDEDNISFESAESIDMNEDTNKLNSNENEVQNKEIEPIKEEEIKVEVKNTTDENINNNNINRKNITTSEESSSENSDNEFNEISMISKTPSDDKIFRCSSISKNNELEIELLPNTNLFPSNTSPLYLISESLIIADKLSNIIPLFDNFPKQTDNSVNAIIDEIKNDHKLITNLYKELKYDESLSGKINLFDSLIKGNNKDIDELIKKHLSFLNFFQITNENYIYLYKKIDNVNILPLIKCFQMSLANYLLEIQTINYLKQTLSEKNNYSSKIEDFYNKKFYLIDKYHLSQFKSSIYLLFSDNEIPSDLVNNNLYFSYLYETLPEIIKKFNKYNNNEEEDHKFTLNKINSFFGIKMITKVINKKKLNKKSKKFSYIIKCFKDLEKSFKVLSYQDIHNFNIILINNKNNIIDEKELLNECFDEINISKFNSSSFIKTNNELYTFDNTHYYLYKFNCINIIYSKIKFKNNRNNSKLLLDIFNLKGNRGFIINYNSSNGKIGDFVYCIGQCDNKFLFIIDPLYSKKKIEDEHIFESYYDMNSEKVNQIVDVNENNLFMIDLNDLNKIKINYIVLIFTFMDMESYSEIISNFKKYSEEKERLFSFINSIEKQ